MNPLQLNFFVARPNVYDERKHLFKQWSIFAFSLTLLCYSFIVTNGLNAALNTFNMIKSRQNVHSLFPQKEMWEKYNSICGG